MTTTIPDLEIIGRIVRRHVPSPDYKVFLFGSRTCGTAAANADWDIGILGPDELPGHTLQRIHADLEELPTLHQFDIVDMKSVSESFREVAMKKTLPL